MNLTAGVFDMIALAAQCQENFIVIGAIARDVLCEQFGIEPGGVTQDLDIGVLVEDEAALIHLRDCLLRKGFTDGHRLITLRYGSWKLDILPFGGALGDKLVKLESTTKLDPLNVEGFAEAYDRSQSIEMSGVRFRVPSVADYLYLKFRAHGDRKQQKDAADIWRLVKNRTIVFPDLETEAQNDYFEQTQYVEEVNFEDFEFWTLGKFLSHIWGKDLTRPVISYLTAELTNSASNFISHMDSESPKNNRLRWALFRWGLNDHVFNKSEFDQFDEG